MRRCSALFVVLVAAVGCSDQAAIPPETDGGVDGSVLEDGTVLQDGTLPGDQRAEGIVMRDGLPQWPDLGRDGGGKICGPFPGGGCGKGYVCDIHGCQPGASGVCVPQPMACPDIWSPVCGCDNKTYSNDCERLAAGVPLSHAGACSPTPVDGGPITDIAPVFDGPIVPLKCGPFPGGTCPPSMTCDIHSCAIGASGTCIPTPITCPKLWSPVCGCDGVTYSNDCFRLQAKVALKHVGACATVPTDGGIADAAKMCGNFPGGGCGPGYVCDITGCDITDTGYCVAEPINCPYLWAPVCGCNGQTYANDCIRLLVGVPLKHPGSCTPVDGGIVLDF